MIMITKLEDAIKLFDDSWNNTWGKKEYEHFFSQIDPDSRLKVYNHVINQYPEAIVYIPAQYRTEDMYSSVFRKSAWFTDIDPALIDYELCKGAMKVKPQLYEVLPEKYQLLPELFKMALQEDGAYLSRLWNVSEIGYLDQDDSRMFELCWIAYQSNPEEALKHIPHMHLQNIFLADIAKSLREIVDSKL